MAIIPMGVQCPTCGDWAYEVQPHFFHCRKCNDYFDSMDEPKALCRECKEEQAMSHGRCKNCDEKKHAEMIVPKKPAKEEPMRTKNEGKKCSEQGCGKAAYCKGLCINHYQKANRKKAKKSVAKEPSSATKKGILTSAAAAAKKAAKDIKYPAQQEKIGPGTNVVNKICSGCILQPTCINHNKVKSLPIPLDNNGELMISCIHYREDARS